MVGVCPFNHSFTCESVIIAPIEYFTAHTGQECRFSLMYSAEALPKGTVHEEVPWSESVIMGALFAEVGPTLRPVLMPMFNYGLQSLSVGGRWRTLPSSTRSS